jgi:1-phosphofructokinase
MSKNLSAMPSGNQEQGQSVTVFCPTPVLTVTIEADSKGEPELHLHAGGQGFWIARMIARLGVSASMCAPIGDDTGRLLKPLIAGENVDLRAVPISGVNGAYVHDRRQGHRVEICRVKGSPLTRHEFDDLYNATFTSAMNSGFLVLAGQFPQAVVPRDVYRRLAGDLRANGCVIIADLAGDDLEEALKSGIDLLCFSHEEILKHGGASSNKEQDLVAGLRALEAKGLERIILHRAADPTIVLAEGRLLQVTVPQVRPLDHRGAGDTFLAALAVGLVQKKSLEETIRFAAAAGTLNVLRHGLGTGKLEDIAALSSHIQLQPLQGLRAGKKE